MKRIAVLSALLLATYSATGADLPVIPHASLAALDGTKVMRLNQATFPVYYQANNAPGRPLHVGQYFDEFHYRMMPEAYHEATIQFKNGDEFRRVEAFETLKPFFSLLERWSLNAEYVLIPVRLRLGEYDFEAKAFPLQVNLNDNTRLGDGRLAQSYCAGALYPVSKGELRYEKHRPCILLRGSAEKPVTVFPSLPVPDVELAKELRSNGRHEYFILAKPYHKSTLVYDIQVKHVLLAEPVGLYVFDQSGEYVTSVKSLPALPSTSTFVNGMPSDSQFAFPAQKTSRGKTAKVQKRRAKLTGVRETAPTAPTSTQKKVPTTTVVIE